MPVKADGGFGIERSLVMTSARLLISVSCVVSVAASWVLPGASAADTELRWKFEPGQKQKYSFVQKTANKVEITGRKLDSTLTNTVDLTCEVKGVDEDGTADLVQTFDRIRFEMTAPQGSIEVDTANAKDAEGVPDVLSAVFRAMVGAPFRAKLTARGEFRVVTVPPNLSEAVKKAGPAAALFANEDTLKNVFGQSVLVFPEMALGRGKSWTGVTRQPTPFLGTMVMDNTYTLETPSGPIENIGIARKVAIEPNAESPLEAKVTSQEVKGHYQFDNTVGILKSSEVVQKLSLSLQFNGQQATRELESTVKLELKTGGGDSR
jgi:Family of unknown function (DUF6263)